MSWFESDVEGLLISFSTPPSLVSLTQKLPRGDTRDTPPHGHCLMYSTFLSLITTQCIGQQLVADVDFVLFPVAL